MKPSQPTIPTPQPREAAVQAAVQSATLAFHRREAARPLAPLEFLRQQSRKRWWALQGGVLLLLWWVLQSAGTTGEAQRAMGTLAPLFVVLVLPELWKNRANGALEVECTAYYSLRQVYAARLVLFGLADLALLTVFFSVALLTGRATSTSCCPSWSPGASACAPCPAGGWGRCTPPSPSPWCGRRCGCASSSTTRSTS